jgi:hypothetical protein
VAQAADDEDLGKTIKAIGSSHGDFGFVVEPFDDTTGELLFGLEVVE